MVTRFAGSRSGVKVGTVAVAAGVCALLFNGGGCGNPFQGLGLGGDAGVLECLALSLEAAELGGGNSFDLDTQCGMLDFNIRAIDAGCLDLLSIGGGVDSSEMRDDLVQQKADLGCE